MPVEKDTKWHRFSVTPAEARPVPIASDGSLARCDYADGRLLPVLILDTTERPDIDAMVLAHKTLGPGDAHSYWQESSFFDFGSKPVRLLIRVTHPAQCAILMEFDPDRQGGIVDHIIQSEGLYLIPGRPGDRLVSKIDSPKISVEVPSKHFRAEWDKRLRKATFQRFRTMGMGRGDAKLATESMIRSWRDLTSKRIPRDPLDFEQPGPNV
jgi:hypothetical protein